MVCFFFSSFAFISQIDRLNDVGKEKTQSSENLPEWEMGVHIFIPVYVLVDYIFMVDL